MCRKQSGIAIGRLCDKCDGKCPVCDSYVRPTTLVRICDECSFGNYQNKCVVCGGEGISDAFYCFECTRLEKDRDGCPKIINLGSSRTDVSVTLGLGTGRGANKCLVVLPKENESESTILAEVKPGAGHRIEPSLGRIGTKRSVILWTAVILLSIVTMLRYRVEHRTKAMVVASKAVARRGPATEQTQA